MRKQYVNSISILFAALCFALTACNQGMSAGNGTGTVRISIGGEAARAVDSASGLPVFDEINTKITVTKEDGSKLVDGEQKTSVTIQVPIGTKITVKAVVTTAAGEWSGSKEYTVQAGDNPVTVKLSKTPKRVRNILSSVISQTPYGDTKVTLKLASGKELITNVDIGGNYIVPVTVRDGNGRIYVLYDKGGSRHFSRFDAEGNEDAGFDTAIIPLLPSAVGIEAMTVDPKTDTIFVACGDNCVYAITETSHNTFTRSDGFNRTILSDIGSNKITGAAAYDNTLFLAAEESNKTKLVVCKATVSGNTLSLTAERSVPLNKLRTGSNSTTCTGVFADANGAYCLLREQELGANCYSVGALAYYSSATKSIRHRGLHPDAGSNAKSLAFKSDTFSNPVGFIGYDEDHIYIADDGINIAELNENFHGNGNRNYIVAFNPKMGELTFTKSDATWYQEYPVYKYPETKILLWEKGDGSTYHGMQYWVADTANTPTPASPDHAVWFSTQSDVTPTDVFCYDQDGNLYIVYKDSSGYKVRRFALKSDGSYDKDTAQDLDLNTSHTISAIAVDISDGENYLYYAVKATHTTYEIKRRKYNSTFTSTSVTGYSVTVPISEKIPTLAANRHGLFVGFSEVAESLSGYNLVVRKYSKKEDSSPLGTVIVARELPFIAQAPSSPSHDDYNRVETKITNLQINDQVLYAITSKTEEGMKYNLGYTTPQYRIESFKNSSVLYKVGGTAAETFSGNAVELVKKDVVNSPEPGTSYNFYRFIAVKPKKLVIASDGAWGKDGNEVSYAKVNNNTALEYDLDRNLLEGEGNAGGTFSSELTAGGSGFDWN